jgi:hypothetical protein
MRQCRTTCPGRHGRVPKSDLSTQSTTSQERQVTFRADRHCLTSLSDAPRRRLPACCALLTFVGALQQVGPPEMSDDGVLRLRVVCTQSKLPTDTFKPSLMLAVLWAASRRRRRPNGRLRQTPLKQLCKLRRVSPAQYGQHVAVDTEQTSPAVPESAPQLRLLPRMTLLAPLLVLRRCTTRQPVKSHPKSWKPAAT